MKETNFSMHGRVKLSGAVLGWSVAVLDKFRREAGLKSRSAALSEALAQWAREYGREAALARASAKYGPLYRKAAAREAAAAAKMLPLLRQTRGLP